MRFKKLLLPIATLLIVLQVHGQDIHFSQYYFAPTYLNPAHTGNINGDFRVVANFRSQWWTVNSSFTDPVYLTTSASFDIRLFREALNNDRFGVGVLLFSDKAGDGGLTTQSAMLSLAYHKSTDRFGRHQISFGFQGGVTQKRIFLYDLRFENQFNDIDFNTAFPTGEEGKFDGPIFYPDVSLGALWQSSPIDEFSYYLGFGVFHIAQPTESFLNDEFNSLTRRWIGHAGAEIRLGDYVTLSPSILYMLQSNAEQWNAGLAFDYLFNDDMSFFIGAWTRVKDAMVLTLGTEYKNVRIGASYDINYSDLRTASNAQGALELSLIYIHNNRERSIQYERYCPKF